MGSLHWLWDLEETVSFVQGGGHTVVALQFPDELLGASTAVAQSLLSRLGSTCKVCVLADTAYNPLAVDEVAAQHACAGCVIHYGYASLTPVSQLPAFFVFPKAPMQRAEDVGRQVAAALAAAPSCARRRAAVVILGQEYEHARQALQQAVAAAVREYPDAPQTLVFSAPAARWLEPSRPAPAPGSSQPAATTAAAPSGPCCQALQPPGATACCSNQGQGQVQGSGAKIASGDSPDGTGCCLMRERVGQAGPGTAGEPDDGQQGNARAATMAAIGLAAEAERAEPAAARAAEARVDSLSQRLQSELAVGPTAAAADPTAGPQGGCDGDGGDGGDGGGGAAGVRWQLPDGVREEECVLVWLGSGDAPTLQALQLAYNSATWLCCSPQSPALSEQREEQQAGDASSAEAALAVPPLLRVTEGLAPATQALLRRRYALVERAKAASIVGVLAGTLAAAGFCDAIALVRRAAHAAGKKTYTFVMGKPNPAKLANFPEVDVWVMVADPLGFLFDSKEFLAPIITPHEAVLAFSGRSLEPGARYLLDFGEVLRAEAEAEAAGASGRLGGGEDGRHAGGDEGEGWALQALHAGGAHLGLRSQGQQGALVAARDAADYLARHRQYKGLETPLTGAPVVAAAKVVQGRAGRAAGYEDEPART